MVHKECKPQKQPHPGRCLCQCLNKVSSDPQHFFLANINDVTNTLYEIMLICGIHACKAKAAKELILKAFKHYDVLRHCFDEDKSTQSIHKDPFVRELMRKCIMTNIEAQLAYGIIKRAFKAFFNGQRSVSIRNPITEAQNILEQEDQWVRAGMRTVDIYKEYAGLYFPAKANFKQRIRQAYKELYERMKERVNPIVLESCCCENCQKRIVPTNQSGEKSFSGKPKIPSDQANSQTTARERVVNKNQNLENMPRCRQCKSLKLMCYCNIDQKTGVLNARCSQGQYKVCWRLVDDVSKSRYHECPIDCNELSELMPEDECVESSDSDICECEYECEGGTEAVNEDDVESADEVEDRKSTELSDTQTIYSCHMPKPNYEAIMLEDKKKSTTCIEQKKLPPRKKFAIVCRPTKVVKVKTCRPLVRHRPIPITMTKCTPPKPKQSAKPNSESCESIHVEYDEKNLTVKVIESKPKKKASRLISGQSGLSTSEEKFQSSSRDLKESMSSNLKVDNRKPTTKTVKTVRNESKIKATSPKEKSKIIKPNISKNQNNAKKQTVSKTIAKPKEKQHSLPTQCRSDKKKSAAKQFMISKKKALCKKCPTSRHTKNNVCKTKIPANRRIDASQLLGWLTC